MIGVFEQGRCEFLYLFAEICPFILVVLPDDLQYPLFELLDAGIDFFFAFPFGENLEYLVNRVVEVLQDHLAFRLGA